MDRGTARFPPPIYYIHRGRYFVDPVDRVAAATEFLNTRLYESTQTVKRYGVRTDIIIPDGCLFADYHPRSSSDRKYEMIHGRANSIARDGICMLCANDTGLAMTERGNPHNGGVQAQVRDHSATCLRQAMKQLRSLLELVKSGDSVPARHHYLWHVDHIVCPDPVCRRNNRQFSLLIEFVQHIVGVHHFWFKSQRKPRGEVWIIGNSLSDYCFADEAEAVAYCDEIPRGSRDRVKRKQREAAAKADEDSPSTSVVKKKARSRKGKEVERNSEDERMEEDGVEVMESD